MLQLLCAINYYLIIDLLSPYCMECELKCTFNNRGDKLHI